MDFTQHFLASLASLPPLQQPDSVFCRDFVTALTALDERFINIGVPNAKGILTCNGSPLSKPIDVSDRTYIREALNKKHLTTSGVQIDRAMGRPTINFAYPVLSTGDQNVVVGAAVVVTSLDWWNKLLSKMSLPEQSVAYILDANGNAIVRYPVNAVFELPATFNAVWRGEDGIGRVFTKHQVLDLEGKIQLTFLMGIGVDRELAAVDKHYTLIAIVFSVMVVFVLILFRLFFINSISGPLKTLSQLAHKLGRNEYITSSTLTGVQEMDDLQDTFIEMAELKRQAELRMIQQSQTDSLTGIPNRDFFHRKLADTLLYLPESRDKLGIILFDLDNFKELNDTCGHEVGDEVLRIMTSRLVRLFPSANCISRLGGDEFALLFEGDDAEESRLLALCEEIMAIAKQPFNVSHGEIIVAVIMGIAVYPDDGENVRELMGAADQAMYHAKHCGRDTVRRFTRDLKETLVLRTELVKDLRHAISYQEFYLVYQPIVDRNGLLVKFEALIRWLHPEKGLVSPDQFIPFSEESGQIIEIGNWVISEAKKDLIAIRKAHGDAIQISVNVSPIKLSKQYEGVYGFLESLRTQPDESKGGRQTSGLVVEITEHLLMNLDENTRKALLAFREKGIEVALDDFGTGYSSLSYVMNHDIDYLKIDQSFVQKLDEEVSSFSLCETIISMAHKLGIRVIAEGVETQNQADLLLGYGCDYLQGFYFSKPIPLDQALTFQKSAVIE